MLKYPAGVGGAGADVGAGAVSCVDLVGGGWIVGFRYPNMRLLLYSSLWGLPSEGTARAVRLVMFFEILRFRDS